VSGIFWFFLWSAAMERRFILFFRLQFSICSAVARHRFLSFQEAQRKKAVSSHRTPQKKTETKESGATSPHSN